MTNLVSQLFNLLDGNLVGKLASLLGGSQADTQGAIGAALPKMLDSFKDLSSTNTGAQALFDLIKNDNHDGSVLNNLGTLLGGGNASRDFLESGKTALATLLGSNFNTLLDSLDGMSNLSKPANSSLLGALAPMFLGLMGKEVNTQNLDAAGLASFLSSQSGTIPQPETPSSGGGGLGFLRWLIPLLLAVLAIWLISRSCNQTDTTSAQDDEQTEVISGEGMTLSLDQAGNLVDEAGKVLREVGTFSVDAATGIIKDIEGNILFEGAKFTGTLPSIDLDMGEEEVGFYVDDAGNLVDKDGNIVVKAGEYEEKDGYYVDKQGNRLGRILGKFIAAVKDAAQDVGKAFKDLFSNKEKVGTTYSLQKMEFNKEDHRIETYSIAEIEALAAALKEYPDSKIQIQAYSDDAEGNKAEAKEITSLRAQVLESMLVTLGVNKKQISTKGMGAADAAKASNDLVEILVK